MNKENTASKLITSLFDTTNLSKDSVSILNSFDEIIQGVRPLNSRQLQQLPDHIRELSHQLTDDRASRRLGYMNEAGYISAYISYFMWWNLVRMTRLFANLPKKSFEPLENGENPVATHLDKRIDQAPEPPYRHGAPRRRKGRTAVFGGMVVHQDGEIRIFVRT